MTEREALKLALEALGEIEWSNDSKWQSDRAKVAITAIKEALAQPEQEPCRHRIADIRNEAVKSGYMCMDCGALFGAYTTPQKSETFPQRTWVGLTSKEKENIFDFYNRIDIWNIMQAVEDKLKEKNT